MHAVIGTLLFLSISSQAQECGNKPPQRPWTTDPEINPMVIYGREADPNSWPWMASFKSMGSSGEFGLLCGAALFDRSWALTAAHCVGSGNNPEGYRLDFGLHNVTDIDTPGVEIRNIDMIIRHYNFTPDLGIGFPNDIALLRLTEPVEESDQIKYACIPEEGKNFTRRECWISGWGLVDANETGMPDMLHEGPMLSISNEECRALHIGEILDSHICGSIGAPGFPNGCYADSGSPLHCYDTEDQTWYAAGFASWNLEGCQAYPGVFSRTSHFKQWIDETITIYAPE